MCVAGCLKIAVIVCSVILILLSIAYFVWASELDPNASDFGVAVFVYIFTAILLWILAAVGIYGAVKEKPKCATALRAIRSKPFFLFCPLF